MDGARSAPYDPLVHLVDGLIGRVAARAVALVVAALAVAVPAGAGAASAGTPALRPVKFTARPGLAPGFGIEWWIRPAG